ncbi:hypothetical protein V5O48_008613 [Marasmius crinis-equi]|uniref:Uncharacterized protein n=1 Tax=Marasmius crinis-equi TaxID=585013 RepID=A0ABR3FDF5_9AGAR
MSEHSLTPVECSPGVVFVRPQHIIPHLITVIDHPEVIEALCFPFLRGRQRVSLLRLARQPLPSLLPLLEPVVTNILNHKAWNATESVLEFVQWMKSLLPDPEYHSKTVSLMQQVRDWTIRTSSQDRFLWQQVYYKEICEILDEAGIGNVGGSGT